MQPTIQIIFENENFIIINKPAGIVVHPFDFSDEYTLVDFLHEHSPEMFSIENEIILQDKRIIKLGGIVHKLDRETSGIMVVAKNEITFHELQKQFKRESENNTIKKVYSALVHGIVTDDTFIINAPLGRNKKDYRQSVNPSNPRGELRDAITHVTVLERNKETTLVELAPETGRTHQLRVHMAHSGHPIVGDKVYGLEKDKESTMRLFLHAQKLAFTLDGKNYFFEAPLPEGFASGTSPQTFETIK